MLVLEVADVGERLGQRGALHDDAEVVPRPVPRHGRGDVPRRLRAFEQRLLDGVEPLLVVGQQLAHPPGEGVETVLVGGEHLVDDLPAHTQERVHVVAERIVLLHVDAVQPDVGRDLGQHVVAREEHVADRR